MEIVIKIKRSHAFVITILLVLIFSVVLVRSFGGSAPSVVGHSPGEVLVNGASVIDGSLTAVDLMDAAVNASKINASQVQRRVGSTCGAGSSIRVINEDGTVSCETDDAGGGISGCAALSNTCGGSPTSCTSPNTGGGSRLTGVACDCGTGTLPREIVSVSAGNFGGQVTCTCSSATSITALAFSCS